MNVIRKLSRTGIAFAVLFLLFSGWMLYQSKSGHEMATIFIMIATIPFSIILDTLVQGLHLTLENTIQLELVLVIGWGLIEYYWIGKFLEYLAIKAKEISDLEMK